MRALKRSIFNTKALLGNNECHFDSINFPTPKVEGNYVKMTPFEGRMGVGPHYLSFISNREGRGLRAYTGSTTLPNLLNHIKQLKDIANIRRFQIVTTKK
jgi:hypothetical protein